MNSQAMPEDNFDIRSRVKYREEWDWDVTRKWMKEVQDSCKNNFKNVTDDYKKYKRAADNFAVLEEKIAIDVFGITEKMAKRAFMGTALLPYFKNEQRKLATQIRQKMNEISDNKNEIEMQVVPIASRMNEDLKKGKDNKNTGKIIVFRVKDRNGDPVFLDCHLRKYDNWKSYLDSNKAPQCIMCFPKDGFLRKKELGKDGKNVFVANDVQFGEPPSCNPLTRMKDSLDIVVACATPVMFLVSWCPAMWPLSSYALSCATTGLFYYGLATISIQLVDKINHGEDYGAVLMTFITSISSIMDKGVIKYLRLAVENGRPLTTLESTVVNAVKMGLSGPQVASFVWMTCSLACKREVEPMDIVGYVIACHNLYSFVVSPKAAGQLLKKIRNGFQKELQKTTEALTEEKNKLVKNEAMLKELENTGGNDRAIAQVKKEISEGQTKVKQLEIELQSKQEVFSNNTELSMEDKNVRKEFNDKNEMSNMNQRGDNTEVDQNSRIITVVTYMDAEMVFKSVSIARSKIQFSNGESMDLSANAELDIHPRAFNQKEEPKKSDMQKMIECTQQFTAGKIEEKDFLEEIRTCLKFYQLIKRTEQTMLTEYITSQLTDERLKARLAAMTPGEAYRIRTVLDIESAHLLDNDQGRRLKKTRECAEKLDLAWRLASGFGANNNTNDKFTNVASCVELVKLEHNKFEPNDDKYEDNSENRTKFHKAQMAHEIKEMIKKGIQPEEATRLAKEEFNKREEFQKARVEVGLGTGSDEEKKTKLKAARLANFNRDLIKLHDGYKTQNFNTWITAPSKEEQFFSKYRDPAALDQLVAGMEQDVDRIMAIADTQSLTITNPLATLYHVRKHRAGRRETFICQDDLPTSTIYYDKIDVGRKCFGVTKCKYDAHLGREISQPEVATHFPRD